MKSPQWHERVAELQERHAASQQVHAQHARELGFSEMALRADGRANLARARAKKQRRLAAEAARRHRRS